MTGNTPRSWPWMMVLGSIILFTSAGDSQGPPLGVDDPVREDTPELPTEEGEPQARALLAELEKVNAQYPVRVVRAKAEPQEPTASESAQAQAAAATRKLAADRQQAFERKRDALARTILGLPDAERMKAMKALPTILVQNAEGETAIHAAILLDTLRNPALAESIRIALSLAVERLDDQAAAIPEPVRLCLAELAGRFASMLGALQDRDAIPLILRTWKQESSLLNTAFAIEGLACFAEKAHEKVLADAFDKARSSGVRREALRGLCRIGSPGALSRSHRWLAEAIPGDGADDMRSVRDALGEFPETAGEVASLFARQALGRFANPGVGVESEERPMHLAALDVALLLGHRLGRVDASHSREILGLVADAGNRSNGGELYRQQATHSLGISPVPLGESSARSTRILTANSVSPGAFQTERPFTAPDGSAIPADSVSASYGKSFRILAGWRDIRDGWECLYGEPLRIVGTDLSADGWEKTVVPRNEVQVDPRTGRLKFATGDGLPVRLAGRTKPGHDLFFAWPDQVVLRGNFAYMSNGENWDAGLAVIDLTDPKRPALCGTSYLGGFARAIQVCGDYAYVGNASGGFSAAVGIRELERGEPLKSWQRLNGVSGPAMGLDGERKLLFSMAGNRLKVLSLKDPMKPEELGGVDLGAMATDMKAGDGVVCALCPQAAVFIDCADPTSPRVVSRVGLNAPHDVEISSGHAYISDTADGTVAILDIRDAPRPKLLSKIRGLNWNGLRLAVAQSGDRRMLFVAEYGAGDVRIYDVTDPGAPKEVGRWVNVSPWGGLPGRGGNLADVASDGKIAVVTNLCFGLHVLDVSDPARPTLLGEVRCAGEAGNLAVIDEETVAVEDYCQALLLFDTKDPANMHVVGQYPMGGRVWPGLVYRRPHCLISNQFPGGIIQVDVSDRQRPRPTSALVYESIGTGCMVARGHHAYVAHRYGYNVTVLDVSDPKRLRKVGATRPGSVSSFPSFDTTEDLLLAAQFCADSGPGPLGIFDITDPGHLRKIAALPLPGGCSSVSVQGSIAFCAGGGRLRAVDIRNPFRPRVIGDVPCDLGAIRVRGEYAYAIKGKGIAVFRVPLWAPDSDRWASWNALDNVGDTGDLHTAWLCSLDIRGPRAYAVAYNQLFAVEVPWSQLPPEPVTLIIGDVK